MGSPFIHFHPILSTFIRFRPFSSTFVQRWSPGGLPGSVSDYHRTLKPSSANNNDDDDENVEQCGTNGPDESLMTPLSDCIQSEQEQKYSY